MVNSWENGVAGMLPVQQVLCKYRPAQHFFTQDGCNLRASG